ncbi:hypothetical protein HPP92_024204 [Vanilla planifolia]|uniref:ABC transporter domain-containing protein n=1 Tax=Vanilla planifolia TaxID=51239 RepID=A0A835UEG7_VANPL|nr:hypothetical protein HPP92_024204 [Vanilla planifolia]
MAAEASIRDTDPEEDISKANLLTVDSGDVNLSNLSVADKRILVDRIMKTMKDDNEQFLRRIKDRIKRVDLELPKVEVRFEHLSVEADALVGSRAGILGCLNFSVSKKRVNKILTDASGILKPSRMCLLLGPPGSGKTTLLLALAGKLDKNLKVTGKITYCGCEFKDFVPQRTGAYVSQHDIHVTEMTVRETFDFSAQCLGTGNRSDILSELTKRERDAGIIVDAEIDALMKLLAVEGQKLNLGTDYILKALGLDGCADVIIGDEMRRGVSGGEKKRVTVDY